MLKAPPRRREPGDSAERKGERSPLAFSLRRLSALCVSAVKRSQATTLFLLALLPLAAGSGSRAQEASPLKARYTRHEYQIAMRDGVKLFTRI